MRKKNVRRFSVFMMSVAMLFAVSCGSSGGNDPATEEATAAKTPEGDSSAAADTAEVPAEEPVYEADILSITFTGAPIADDYQAKLDFEEITNSKIHFSWISNSNYAEQFGVLMASGDMPAIVTVTGLDANIVRYIRAGAFWNIKDEIGNYEYLKLTDPVTIANLSVDGGLYGIPRTRPVGRNGITYRRDWANQIGIDEPRTIDDLEKLFDHFTNGDPDGNGVKDTYALRLCIGKYDGPLDIITTWFNGGNQWVDVNGELRPYFETPGYVEAMNWVKKMYDAGYINDDAASLDTAIWADDINAGVAGVHIDVTDQAQRTDAALIKLDPKYEGATWAVGHVDAGYGDFNLPTTGYSGFVAITKSGAKTEEDMRSALEFLDRTNTAAAYDIFTYGLEGKHWELNAEGYVERITVDENDATSNIMDGFNQFMTNVSGEGHIEKRSAIRQRVYELQNGIEAPYSVINPAITYSVTSEVYQEDGATLDQIRKDARVNYIVGALSWTEYEAEMREWYEAGGDDLIAEYNTFYQ